MQLIVQLPGVCGLEVSVIIGLADARLKPLNLIEIARYSSPLKVRRCAKLGH